MAADKESREHKGDRAGPTFGRRAGRGGAGKKEAQQKHRAPVDALFVPPPDVVIERPDGAASPAAAAILGETGAGPEGTGTGDTSVTAAREVTVPAGASDTQGSAAPLLYRNPVPVSREESAGLRLLPGGDYSFARDATVVPLCAGEFATACRHYPVVFATDAARGVAVLGAGGSGNSFVDHRGAWQADHYVPAYLRRYPFTTLADANARQVLCVDLDAPLISETNGEPLFDDGAPTPVTEGVMKFCQAYLEQEEYTRNLLAAVEAENLLIDHSVTIPREAARPLTVTGFRVIDQRRLARVDDQVWQRWRELDYVLPICAHVISQRNWSTVAAS